MYNSDGGYKLKKDGDYSRVYGNRVWNLKENLHYKLNDQIKLTGRAGYFFRERDSQATSKDRYRSFNGGIKGNYDINEKNSLELAYAFDQYDKSNFLTETKSDVRDYSNVQNSLRGLYNYTLDERAILTLGGDYMRDYLMSYQFKDNGSYQQHVADVFAQFDWTPVERFNTIAGLRYDYFSDNHISRVSPKLSMMYKLGNYSLRGSYAGGFRAPTLKEKYMVFDMASIFMIYGNPDLKSKSSHNFSASGEYTRKYYNVSLMGYYNLVDNRITTAWSQDLKGMLYINTDHIKNYGVGCQCFGQIPL